ncbi:DUF4145 domain-containing protein [Phenylobacterium sp. 20VBR1]|uniref:DUF4145 domain-containing protein n=1 Tax=Phenylobacterium glaciei TaxID=2803784 RepID=A0A941CWU9_9CAUL|nr:DUF4145 domain-containing protein [Phenylobacterium glaciei]MBR7617817.1 DUF4145 domain-containing protein [Phenylobacterium glaciei]
MSEDPSPSAPIPSDRNPRLGLAAFVCPHCKAYTQQRWFTMTATYVEQPPTESDPKKVRELLAKQKAADKRGEDSAFPTARLENYLAALEDRRPLVDRVNEAEYVYWHVNNALLSDCFVCKKVAVWVGGRLRFPVDNPDVPEPNEDLPGDIRRDYVEAGEIVSASPRAAAALLRLAIEKLCAHLLEREAKINTMIGDLVARGLNPMIQRALDIVRVVGNEAIHPGSIDLRDDQATAMQLFGLVNLIAEQMITQPKHVMALYGTLPPDKVAGIEQRDAKAKQGRETPE